MSLLTLATSNTLMRWAAGGWAFFIAENFVLSENRTWIIDEVGDENYHLAYGTCSTLATASIGYAYYSIGRTAIPPHMMLWRKAPPVATSLVGWACLSLGLVMASQAAPKMQIPFGLVDSNTASTGKKVQVRCPFDFSDKNVSTETQVRGMERISRHPGLWSFGLVGLGQAALAPTLPLQVWWMGPAAIALLGGTHTDSRFRRGMGGTLTPEYDSQTSNVPFVAMITGKQGSGAWQGLGNEVKPLNALFAVALTSLYVLRRVR